jgi:predicted Zn finger-like uncharacterized protein
MMLYGPSMIIACPACTTRYVVPDSAIGADGRTVRCAKCRHSWFQDANIVLPEERPLIVPVAKPKEAPPPPPSVEAEPATTPRIPETAPEPVAQAVESDAPSAHVYANEANWAYDEPDQSSFLHEPPFRPRLNRLKLWTWAAGVFATVSLAAIAAVAWFGLPQWMPLSVPHQTFADAQPDLVLDFPQNRQERRILPNGTEFFGASGTVTNVGRSRRTVPTILIVLRDSRERIVYSWEVAPPQRLLAPGESTAIHEAVTDVPKSAKFAEIGWKPG